MMRHARRAMRPDGRQEDGRENGNGVEGVGGRTLKNPSCDRRRSPDPSTTDRWSGNVRWEPRGRGEREKARDGEERRGISRRQPGGERAISRGTHTRTAGDEANEGA